MAETTLGRGARITGAAREQLAAQLVQRYERGESIRAIATDLGRSYGWVQGMLKQAGVTLRGRGGPTRGQAGAERARVAWAGNSNPPAGVVPATEEPPAAQKTKVKKAKVKSPENPAREGADEAATSTKSKAKGRKPAAEQPMAGIPEAPAKPKKPKKAKAEQSTPAPDKGKQPKAGKAKKAPVDEPPGKKKQLVETNEKVEKTDKSKKSKKDKKSKKKSK
ncbi:MULTISPECIES: helix-turn-helix domain-containing protein [unclassified Luteococcus]|uniref:helix-turn-helix domain-containing protein n=1 Tax=unclassified Luteococcus TaxID=2639923 RepID=UPI00313EF5ED